MKHIHVMPEIHARQPAARATPGRRKPEPIPSMQPEKGRGARRYTDAEIVALILANLRGERYAHIAARTGMRESLVRQYCNGTLRSTCLTEADRLWRIIIRTGAADG